LKAIACSASGMSQAGIISKFIKREIFYPDLNPLNTPSGRDPEGEEIRRVALWRFLAVISRLGPVSYKESPNQAS
jgi:hypothetical protein